jgi:signal transduction histidine kinase
MYSLRRTLSVRFSITMFVALMLIGMGAFVGVRRTLSRLTDQSLLSALELESDVLALGRSVAVSPYQNDVAAFVEGINRFVVIREASGQIVVRNTPLAAGLPLDSAAFLQALNGGRAWATERWANGQIRSLYSRTPAGSHPGFAVLQVSASLSPLARTDRGIFLFIFGIVILATAGTAVGAGWLAKSAVAPVALITERAKAIHAGTLGKRISAHADTVEFHGLVGVLNSMLERLDRALAAQRRIIADVGHELRTPITAMQGELEIALRGSRTAEEYRMVLQSCLEEAEHLSDIDESLLLLARLEAGEHQADPIPVQVCDIVEQCVAQARVTAPSHTFEFSPCCETPSVLADSKLFRIVVDQLLDNSVKHTPPGTHVRATADCSSDQFVLAIEDDGPGIPEEALPHLFDRFWQADPARTRGSGPGLGLTIAAAVAEAHDGSVAAARSEMGGLNVTMHLPLSAGALVQAPPVQLRSSKSVKISS